MDLSAVLEKLCTQNGPSGFEGSVVRAAKDLLTPLMDEVYVDTLGSVIGVRRCGEANAKKILLDEPLHQIDG